MLQPIAWMVSLPLVAVIAGIFIHIVAQNHVSGPNHLAAAKSTSWRGHIR